MCELTQRNLNERIYSTGYLHPEKRGVCCITKVLFVIWLKNILEQAAGQSIDPAAVGTNPKNGKLKN